MSAKEKERLLERLSEAHEAVEATLKDVSLDKPVFKDTGWLVRDILGHIATRAYRDLGPGGREILTRLPGRIRICYSRFR